MAGRKNDVRRPDAGPRRTRGQAAVVVACALFAVAAVAVVTLFVVGYCMLLDAAGGGSQTAQQPTAAASAAAAADSAYDAAAGAIDTAVYSGTVLAPTEDAGQGYVDGTLFIGDSNTYRYMNYGYNTLENNIGIVGMSTALAVREPCVRFAGYADYVTIPDAVALMQPQRVLIGFGTNDLTGDVAWFVSTYTKTIQAISNAYPYFDVIVNAIPPVAKQRSYTSVTMQQVDTFNAALVEMCEANGWKFLNSSEALKDPDTGFCREGYTVSDGLHLSRAGCEALFAYFRTHAQESEDRRPQPLAAVPVHEETPLDLIVKDPLKEDEDAEQAVIDVTFTAGEGGTLDGETEQSAPAGGVCAAVTAVPKEGYAFAGWSCNAGVIADPAEPVLAFVVPEALDAYGGIFVTAWFEKLDAGSEPPDEEETDEEETDGEETDGEEPDGEEPDGEEPDGEEPDGEMPDGEMPDGETPDGETPVPGQTPSPPASPKPEQGAVNVPSSGGSPSPSASPAASAAQVAGGSSSPSAAPSSSESPSTAASPAPLASASLQPPQDET